IKPSTGCENDFPKVAVFTFAGVKTVSLEFSPVREMSLCCVSTPANPLLFVVWFVTLRIDTPFVDPTTACIDVNPAVVPAPSVALVATPAALTEATLEFEDVHVALDVRFWVLPSLKWPVAVNGCVAPLSAIDGFWGLTTTTCSETALTVNIVEPFTAPSAALIVEVPFATALANPFVPAVLLIVAIPVLLELHVTVVVRFCVLLSENFPVAVNCSVPVVPMVGFAGVTAIDTSVAAVTVRVADPLMAPEAA